MSKAKPDMEFISVIIPTYKDMNSLAKCIQALENQTIDEYFQIIVVDNDPSSNEINLSNKGNIQIIKEKKRGSYAARNAGIRIAKKGILAFTDADCRPSPDWLREAVAEIRNGKYIVAGLTNIVTSKKPSIIEIYEKCLAFDFNHYKKLNKAPTANLIVRSDVFDVVGHFSELSMSTGDMEWCSRATKAGYKINFCLNIIVDHPARKTFGEISSKVRRVTIGNLEHKLISKKVKLSIIVKSLIPSRRSITFLVRGKTKLSYEC